ncbi:uncharacterized protein FPRO_07678 [Fusarium proliferatum ET1]|uniref:Protein kinase domain-containing protein n=1 Tax=Fusarium proliferatum (strain ET1) TaxID=1227346 RepID=A0A1L7VUF4_FUSPR|nr:uncharacterized protein FPRO_07678 [Fusarium proliferatum ET1]CZR43405.1 uncharacterized protein FPRO_07678 [Fusarium proliferatum ET1]
MHLSDREAAHAIRAILEPLGRTSLSIVYAAKGNSKSASKAAGFWGHLGDVSPRNVLVFDDLHAKLCDFAGSILKGKFPEVLFTCEPRCWVPGPEGDSTTRSILEKELCALGTAICEITEWTVSYGPIEIDELQQKLMDGEYPYVDDSNHVKHVIQKLWHFEYSSAQEVVEAPRTALIDT